MSNRSSEPSRTTLIGYRRYSVPKASLKETRKSLRQQMAAIHRYVSRHIIGS